MALLELNVGSRYLNGNTAVTVILPDRPMEAEQEEYYRSGTKCHYTRRRRSR